jgi:hypothetical protein
MEREMRKDIGETTVKPNAAEGIIVSHLLHPTSHFEHPSDVLRAAHLSAQEKRAILASWASDQYAVESIPALRHYPGSAGAVSLADILAALKSLDGDPREDWKSSPDCGRAARRLDLRCLVPLRRRVRKSTASA